MDFEAIGSTTCHLDSQAERDLDSMNAVFPGLAGRFEPANYAEVAQRPGLIDQALLEGHVVNFSRSLIRLAWLLQRADTIVPLASEIQAALNSQTAGVGAHVAIKLPSKSCHVPLSGGSQVPYLVPLC